MDDITTKSHKMAEHLSCVVPFFYIPNTLQEVPNQFSILFVVYAIPDEGIFVVYSILCGLHRIYLYNKFLITMYWTLNVSIAIFLLICNAKHIVHTRHKMSRFPFIMINRTVVNVYSILTVTIYYI